MKAIPFKTIQFDTQTHSEHKGEQGLAIWNTLQLEGLRIRRVIYEPGYLADHWCQKGHIVYCVKGSIENELQTGEKSLLNAGMCYVVSDDMSSHRSFSEHGAELLIVDGDFLNIPI
ncbi:MAG: DHCW motif cupin fold protein [Flavobacteriales bacterium]